MAKPRIAILGGGAGAVTTALQLSKPGWRDEFESITLYQQGWRLGGKGACGRGPELRIEEHGLHVWFGFYENAFGLLQRCHEELDQLAESPNGPPRWELAFTNVEESFSRLNEIGVADHDGCDWGLWMADFFDEQDDRPWYPPERREPGAPPDEWTVVSYVARCLQLGADLAWSLVMSDPKLGVISQSAAEAREGVADIDEAIDVLLAVLGGDIRELLGAVADLLDALAEAALDAPLVLDSLGIVVRALDFATDFLRRRYDDLARESDFVRRAYYVVDLMVAIARGAIEDGVIEADSFDVIEDVDLSDWLLAHGALRDSANCALVRGIVYDLGFAYEGGDPGRPACAAGTALRGLLRAFFTYRGSLMWRMNAGMGDVVFLPFYELLVKRGVRVNFFHRVEELRVANGKIQEIEIDVQANVPSPTPPRAYVTSIAASSATGAAAAAEPILAWPAEPTAILGGVKRSPPETYESWYAARTATQVDTKVLRRGEPDGFDIAVFGLPISCVPNVAPALMSEPRWKRSVDHLLTVPTQAMQLWLKKPASHVAGVDEGTVISGYVEPFDTWADMSQLVSQERVKDSVTVAYFCNVLPDSPPPPRGQADGWLKQQKALVYAQARRFLAQDVAALWPGGVDTITGELDWDLLVAPKEAEGPARLGAQYLRANVEPSERYVLSVPGSSRHRIAPDDTGFANLYAAGDWTACGLNAGCVEAAVISGMLAANAIHRTHGDAGQVEPIIGLKGP